jgi:glycosyltransferase involved in cell wall biosynthesis
MRGGEKVLEALCELFPTAVIFTLLYQPEKVSKRISRHEVRTSFLEKIPGFEKNYRIFLPLFPKAIESFNFDDFDLCISVSHSVAKGIRVGPDSLHICLCLTPMRYIWDRFDDYFTETGGLKRYVAQKLFPGLRRWDTESSSRVDLFVSISEFVRWRVQKFYNRPSKVIYPFADTDYYKPEIGAENIARFGESGGDYYLVVSALVPYKRVGDVVTAFDGFGRRLVIAGDGPEKEKLVKTAPPNVEFTGWISDQNLLSLYRNCRALIFPGVEDFGIVPVEVQACGRPVLALAEGGALETVVGPIIGESVDTPDATGLFFRSVGPDQIRAAIKKFETMAFDPETVRQNALRFAKPVFMKAMLDFVTESYSRFKAGGKAGLETRMMTAERPEARR